MIWTKIPSQYDEELKVTANEQYVYCIYLNSQELTEIAVRIKG
jgi:hypothetical protein